MATTSAPRLTKAEILNYLDLKNRQHELRREASDLGKQADEIEAKMAAAVRAKGGKQKSVRSCGYLLALVTKAGSVSWKKAFVDRVGQKEAEKLVKAAQPKEDLTIESIA